MSDSDGFGAFFAGFVIGGMIGAATALLLAPQSGEQTRSQIQERGIEIQAKAQETLVEARKRADDLIAEAQEKSRVILEEQKTRLGTALEEGKRAIAEKTGTTSAVLETEPPAAS
jgi:gas vesicle protein